MEIEISVGCESCSCGSIEQYTINPMKSWGVDYECDNCGSKTTVCTRIAPPISQLVKDNVALMIEKGFSIQWFADNEQIEDNVITADNVRAMTQIADGQLPQDNMMDIYDDAHSIAFLLNKENNDGNN